MSAELSILIPTRNRAMWLETLLQRLLDEPAVFAGKVSVHVSDNGSDDHTAALVAELQARFTGAALKLTIQPENLGLSGNVRWLVEAASSRYVWVLGDDDLPAPGAVAEVRLALGELSPQLLFLPHRFQSYPGAPAHQSPCPDTLEVFSSGKDLALEYTHWLSFISAAVVRREALTAAIAAAPTQNPWAPYIWYALASRGGACAVLAQRLLLGAGEVSWTEAYQSYMTTRTVDTYDDGLRLMFSPAEFARLLDERCRTGGANEAWDAAPLEELVAAVRRFPASRLLRKKLANRVQRRSRLDILTVIGEAVVASGDNDYADRLVAEGEQRFVAGDVGGAAAALAAALDISPTHVAAWCDLGVVQCAQGRFEAVFSFDSALELDPEHVGTLLNRATWALVRGLRAQAAADLDRVLSLDPGNDAALALGTQLRSDALSA
jgi:glycosyltransferase involved in cell wall biosynthesis